MNNSGKIGCGSILFIILAYLFIQFSSDYYTVRKKNELLRSGSSSIGNVTGSTINGNENEIINPLLHWNYDESSEKMGRGTIKTATIWSLNEVNFDFPYSGAQRGMLQIRIHPRFGRDVTLSIKKDNFSAAFIIVRSLCVSMMVSLRIIRLFHLPIIVLLCCFSKVMTDLLQLPVSQKRFISKPSFFSKEQGYLNLIFPD